MADKIDRRNLQHPYTRVIAMTLVQTLGWFYANAYAQRGLYLNHHGEDLGVRSLIVASMVAISWGAVLFAVSRKVFGRFSFSGYLWGIGGTLVIGPLAVLEFVFWVPNNTFVAFMQRHLLALLPQLSALSGINPWLPMDSGISACMYGLYALVMFACSFLGFRNTVKKMSAG